MPRDFYPTPIEAVYPIFDHLEDNFLFAEPCAGDGALINHLERKGLCTWASDIEPQAEGIYAYSYEQLTAEELMEAEFIITNPPWNRKILHPMIDFFTSKRVKTWLLFDADWMHTKQSISYLKHLSKIVSIGRVKWIEGSSGVGKDNCCWYLFENNSKKTEFFGRKDLTLLS